MFPLPKNPKPKDTQLIKMYETEKSNKSTFWRSWNQKLIRLKNGKQSIMKKVSS